MVKFLLIMDNLIYKIVYIFISNQFKCGQGSKHYIMGYNPNLCDLKSLLLISYSKTHMVCCCTFLKFWDASFFYIVCVEIRFCFSKLIFLCYSKWVIFWITKSLTSWVLCNSRSLVVYTWFLVINFVDQVLFSTLCGVGLF